MGDAQGAGSGGSGEPPARAYRIPSDSEVVAALMKVILEETSIASQRRFRDRVVAELKRRDPDFVLGEARLRNLALRSGLVDLEISARVDGEVPELARCPVCRGPLERTANRTLTGGTVATGYRCTRCTWWTGRSYRIPRRYAFSARLEKQERKQTSFKRRANRL